MSLSTMLIIFGVVLLAIQIIPTIPVEIRVVLTIMGAGMLFNAGELRIGD